MKKIINYPFKLMRDLYDWTISFSKSKHSNYALFTAAFIESSFFPIPPDVLLIPLVVGEPKKWIQKASICALGSICGAFLGYLIGYVFFETVGTYLVNLYNLHSAIDLLGEKYAENAFLAVFSAAFTPLPYKAITISAGMFKISLLTLFLGSLFGRAGRFFIVAGALRIFGAKIQHSIEKYFNILSITFLVLLIAGFVLLKYAF
ncbi:MAG: VTT domain-containing protein [Elusimicrobiota bacterium]|jgi:membrane protein YqaA with SNARE-associated domain|nr:VTT domain-containing protein [Elusimicrobiota bacterium]